MTTNHLAVTGMKGNIIYGFYFLLSKVFNFSVRYYRVITKEMRGIYRNGKLYLVTGPQDENSLSVSPAGFYNLEIPFLI